MVTHHLSLRESLMFIEVGVVVTALITAEYEEKKRIFGSSKKKFDI